MKVSMITRRGIGSEASQDRVLIGGHVFCDEEFFEEFDKPCAVGIADGVGGMLLPNSCAGGFRL